MRDPSTYGWRLSQSSAVFDVLQLERAEVLVQRPGRLHALAAGGAVVADPHDDAALGEQLVIQEVRAAPRIDDLLEMRPCVGELIDRIPPSRIEVRRLDHHRFHDEPVAGLHLHQLRLSRARALSAPEHGSHRRRAPASRVLVSCTRTCGGVVMSLHESRNSVRDGIDEYLMAPGCCRHALQIRCRPAERDTDRARRAVCR